MMNRDTRFENLGIIDYKEAWDYQEKLFNQIVDTKQKNRKNQTDQASQNCLILCEHPHVYTIGKSGNSSNLLIDEKFLKSKGAKLYRINRGGDITYHGPGQVVGYPILDLDSFGLSIKSYINHLEQVIINTLKHFGIESTRSDGATGVWLDAESETKARKICAIGVRTSHWVSMHGFALNVNTDLSYFDYIIPCGIAGKQVTSIQKETRRIIDTGVIHALLINEFKNHFGMVFK